MRAIASGGFDGRRLKLPEGAPPLVVHVVHRFDTGGLENGVVNLINHMPRGAYRHLVVALTEVTDFRQRLRHNDVECVALHKAPGHGAKLYPQLWRLLRQWRPAIVHTRNLAALEMQACAWAAGVPIRIHGEHGRDVEDLDGTSRHYQRVRRLYAPFVHRHVALSQDLAAYLTQRVGIAPQRVEQIYNGVDADRFAPAPGGPVSISGAPFAAPAHWLIGTVGRMQTVKHQTLLARAFVRALVLSPPLRDERDRLAAIEGVRAGIITILSSGHDPQSQEDKRQPFADARAGMAGAETLLALGLGLVRDGVIDLPQLVAMLSTNPARRFGLVAGTLQLGAPADLVVFDEAAPWRIDGDQFHGAGNTPFNGLPTAGRVRMTIKGGDVVWRA